MAINVVLVPDIYYRNWETPEGEMWLILRPTVYAGKVTDAAPLGEKLENFLAWARSPHQSVTDKGHVYNFHSPHKLGLGQSRCEDGQSYLPINLPSDVDLEIQIGRGTEPPQIIEVPRSTACKVILGSRDGVDCFAPSTPTTAKAFVRAFHDDLSARFGKLSDTDPDLQKAIFLWLQQMESGRRLRVAKERVHDLYELKKVPMPVLDEGLSPDGPITSIYWLLGQMIRIGTKSNLSEIKKIDRLDILLKVGGKVIDHLHFPDAQGGMEDAKAYFSKVGDGFTRSLECGIDQREGRIYVSPGFRSARLDQTADGKDVWIIERPAQQQADSSRPAIASQLSRLAAIEFRGTLPQAKVGALEPNKSASVGDAISFRPGLLVTGTLKPYRRFPMLKSVKGGETRRTTVLELTPDPSVARALEALRVDLTPLQFSKLFSFSSGGWRFSLLHAGPLPWDGAESKFKIVAEDTSRTLVAAGDPLMCEQPSLSLFMTPLSEGAAIKARRISAQRSLWEGNAPPFSANSPLQLANQWAQLVGPAWAKVEFNALRVQGLTSSSDAAINLMMLDEFELAAAESPVRLERVLATLAQSPRTAELCNISSTDPRSFDPLRDYEDDYVNQNSAHITFQNAGKTFILGPKVLRTPMRSEVEPKTCKICDVNRRQTIPLLHSWPSDPMQRPKDEWPSKPPKVTWDMVRREVAHRYALLPDGQSGPFRIQLEHTYGDRMVAESQGKAVEFNRSTRRDWPVQLPSYVELAGAKRRQFIEFTHVPGKPDKVNLVFDLSFLTFDPIDTSVFEPETKPVAIGSNDDVKEHKLAYSNAASAWRSLAELASPNATVQLEAERAVFSLEQAFKSKLASPPAASLARDGFPGGWSGGVGFLEPIPVDGVMLEAVRKWASELVTNTPASLPKTQEFLLPLTGTLGDTTHLARLVIRIKRNPSHAPTPIDMQQLVPISQQPGLYSTRPDTMQATWAALGFGENLTALDSTAAGPVWEALQGSQRGWTDVRTVAQHSLNPRASALTDKSVSPAVESALVASLEGTNWFAPAGSGPRKKGRAVQPILLPLGFAPCKPHATLKGMTQIALQHAAVALTDAIDLSYPHWTVKDGTFYQLLFSRIAALATRDGSDWKGPLPSFASLLVDKLFFPQPDASDDGNEKTIQDLATAIRKGHGDLAYLRLAVRRKLIEGPAVFANAKALLLTKLKFVDDAAAPPAPDPVALAGARFQRNTSTRTALHATAISTVSVGLSDLVLSDATASNNSFDERFGFLEMLDDATYGDAFFLPEDANEKMPLGFLVDSFEEKVDPKSTGLPWAQRSALLPLVAANQAGLVNRPVHLASRALLAAPEAHAVEEAKELDLKLQAANAQTLDWGLEDLRKGKPGYGGSGPLLRIIARRPRSTTRQSSIEQGYAYVLYTVTGDEESTQGLLDSLENDRFFFELKDAIYTDTAPEKGLTITPTAALNAEPLLRELAVSERGSEHAAAAIEALAFPTVGADFADTLKDFVESWSTQPPEESNVLLKTLVDTTPPSIEAYGVEQGKQTLSRIREVALFGLKNDVDLSGPRTGYLLVGFEIDVWAPVKASFKQGRNVSDVLWTSGAQKINTPRFAPEFWQSATQEGIATRHALGGIAKANSASHWSKQGHVVKLDATWRNSKTPRELLHCLLFKAGVAIGDYRPQAGILHSSSRPLIFSQELSIQVFHQQFDVDPDEAGAIPFSAIALPSNVVIPANPITEPVAQQWFDLRYDHFSLDFNWFAPNGTRLLSFSNVYVKFT